MIRRLAIRNLAVIESVSVDFEQSFNILTGETGAGKSILVEAVGLLLGGRAFQDLVRTGAELATVEARFELDGTTTDVRREITAQGRSRAFIDGTPATAAALKELSARLVELHGQHEHQLLLDPAQHLPLLDGWAGLTDQAASVEEALAVVRRCETDLRRVRLDDRERAARLDLVEFQLGELTRAQLRPGEDEELGALRTMLRSSDTIRRLCTEAFGELYESEQSVLTGLGHVWKKVGELAQLDPRFAPYLHGREAVKADLEDLAFALRDLGEGIDASPGRLEQVEDRLALIERLKKKHGPTLDAVIKTREALSAEHAALSGHGASPADLEAALREASTIYLTAARRLSVARHQAAPQLTQALERELAALAMPRARLEFRLAVEDDPDGWTPRGIDVGELFISPNPGEDLRPLARIVSGGELSRVMLALKTLSVSDQPGRTLIFDEVDAGIGGEVASVVGEKLRTLGQRFQVLCITHLPQIAVAGSTHFRIEKRVKGSRTVTSVERLGDAERVEEVARMLGGAGVGPHTRATAREMLAAAALAGESESQAPRRKRKSGREE